MAYKQNPEWILFEVPNSIFIIFTQYTKKWSRKLGLEHTYINDNSGDVMYVDYQNLTFTSEERYWIEERQTH